MTSKPPDPGRREREQALRFSLVSQIHALVALGMALAAAVVEVAARAQMLVDGTHRYVSPRSLYRFLAVHAKSGYAGLAPPRRPRIATSKVLPERFLAFLVAEKRADPRASIPELIRRAVQDGVLAHAEDVDRSTAYRAAKRMGLPVSRTASAASTDKDVRRFAYPHRMQVVLCDGKHFRVGPSRARRVALVFLDDSSRMVLHCVVGTSESAALFLRGLYELVCKVGLADLYFMDHGPGFVALDTIEVVQGFKRLLVHGRARYPAGHGKIEALNKTLKKDVLRLWAREDSTVDPDCAALELRLRHYFERDYNVRGHESLGGRTPAEVFDADERELAFPELGPDALRERFVVAEERTVTADNLVSVDGVDYELPVGHADSRVRLERRLLDGGSLWLPHEGKVVRLHPVDLALNARARRGRRAADQAAPAGAGPAPRSAADRAFERDHRPVVSADGDCRRTDDHDSFDDTPFIQES